MAVHLASPLTIASAAVPTIACSSPGPAQRQNIHPTSTLLSCGEEMICSLRLAMLALQRRIYRSLAMGNKAQI